MIRLVFLLLVGIGAVLAILGQDHGQRRAGLQGQPAAVVETQVAEPVAAEPAAAKPADAAAAEVFLPTPPQVVQAAAPVAAVAAAPQAAAPDAATPDSAAPDSAAPESVTPEPVTPEPVALAEPALLPDLVAIQGANLRAGPGRTFAVLASLKAGDRVSPLPDDDPASGWRHVRMADGTEGFVAGRLLGLAD